MRVIAGIVLCLLASRVATPQAPPQIYKDAAALLDAVAKNYASDTPTFHIEAVAESVRTSELDNDRRKSLTTVIKGPDRRYRIEVRAPFSGTWLQDSDGTTEWVFVREANMYVKRAAGDGPQFPKVVTAMGTMEVKNAWEMRTFLDADLEHAKNATMLPDETITLAGHNYPCYVVHATSEGTGRHADRTFWIEKQALVLRKTVEHRDSYSIASPILKIPFHEDVTTTYPLVDFNAHDVPEVFAFVPPADAKEVATLEPEWPAPSSQAPPHGAAKQAPDISLTGPDGKEVKLSSFHGRPLLIDEWATWCAQCLVSMPSVGKLGQDMRGNGLQIISVDRDEDAASATHYLSVHDFTWPNFHDREGKLAQALGENRLPLTLLIDAEGRIVYEGVASDDAALRKAIAGLSSQTASNP